VRPTASTKRLRAALGTRVFGLGVVSNYEKGHPTVAKPTALRPLRLGPLLHLAVHLKVYLLVEEGQKALYLGGLGYRIGVVPDEVLKSLPEILNSKYALRPSY
jgi:hypothetical protein